MENILKILEEVKNASGKAKQDILEKNKDNDLLKEVLFFVYNPYIVTGLSDKKINKHIDDNMVRNDKNILNIFNYLKENHTGTDKDIYYIQSFIFSQPVEYQDIYKEIFTKNLKIGVTSTTINKVWKDLIPTYDVQQGKKLCERIDKIKDEEIILTQKYDGIRCTARVENGNVQLFSRQGQIYEGLVELEQELAILPDGCYDGELIKDMDDSRGNNKNGLPQFLNMPDYKVPEKSIINLLYAPMPSKDLFKQTTSIVNSDEKEKTGIDFFIYDMFPIENFDKMETYNETTETRKNKISILLLTTMGNTPHLKEVPILYSGKFDSILIDAMLKQVLLCKQEGLMINLKNSPYEFKRSNNLIKVKQMYPADLKIIGFEEGTGKNKGTLGALIVNYKGFPVKVGSGFTDAERTYAWEHKTELIGTIVTVQYFEETTNKKDSSLSLRFPVFKRFSSEIKRRKVMTDFIKNKENNMNRYFLTGDTHGNFRRIMNFCQTRSTTENDVLIILGDAGINYYLDDRDEALKKVLSQLPITLFCVHGNHEERPFNISTYKEKLWNKGIVYYEENYPNLLFAKDGEIYDFNGKSVLVIGGAYSVDKEYRISRGYAWFKDEQPSKKIIKYVEKQINKQRHFNIVLSHTCPIKTEPKHMFLPFIDQKKVDKTTEILLQRIADWITFDDWYFGHFHGKWDNGKYHMLFEDYVEIKERDNVEL